jgi:hypothetical protein
LRENPKDRVPAQLDEARRLVNELLRELHRLGAGG